MYVWPRIYTFHASARMDVSTSTRACSPLIRILQASLFLVGSLDANALALALASFRGEPQLHEVLERMV